MRALAGVGPYTARAVRSFAFGEDVAAVDTNAVRVLARAFSGVALTPAVATRLGDRLVPAGLSWEFNQTMFDIGATVCTAAQPNCARCPLRRQCAWRRGGGTGPDPWRLSPAARPQGAFSGSDRQGRGRLLEALRHRGGAAGATRRSVRLARRSGPGTAGGGFAGDRGLRRVVRRKGPRPPPLLTACRRGGHALVVTLKARSGRQRCAGSRRRAAPRARSGRCRRRSPWRSPRRGSRGGTRST